MTRHGADLSWLQMHEPDFDRYEVYRKLGPGVTRSDELMATVTAQSDTTYSDTYSLLEPYYYHYAVYMINTLGVYSCPGNEQGAFYPAIPPAGYPFYDDMESGVGPHWDWGAPWGHTTESAHSGSTSWTDSPGTTYENSVNTALQTAVDLSSAQMPVLSFWERYVLEPNVDFGYVDVSTDGGSSWTTIYFATGTELGWREEQIDLSDYVGQTDVRIRFRVQTNSAGRYDGWYIDDVCIDETATPSIPYPFVDDMEGPGTHDNWISSSWELVTTEYHSPTHSWSDSPDGSVPWHEPGSYLTLSGVIDLSGAQCPQLTFWHLRALQSSGYVDVSTNYGHDWTAIASWSGTQPWSLAQVDLAPYAGSLLRVRFRARYSGSSEGWSIDDVTIYEGPCARVDWCALEAPDSTVTSPDVPTEPIYGLVFESGVTDDPGQGGGIHAELGVGADGVAPWDDGWQWSTAAYDSDQDTLDRYVGTIALSTQGVYDYAYRFQLEGQSIWTYADLNGNDLGLEGLNGYSVSQAGHLIVTGEGEIDVSPTSLSWSLCGGDSASSFLTIRNAGTAYMGFEIFESPHFRQDGGGGDWSRWDIWWLDEEPTSGVIPPADSMLVEVFAHVHEDSMPMQEAYLVIISSDPDESPIVIEASIDPCTGIPGGTPLPAKFALAQSVPNPFSSNTEIRYNLPQECEVRLEVLDIAGRRVAVLVDRRESAGFRSVHWSGNGVANGVYFYRLTAGEFEETKRLILLR